MDGNETNRLGADSLKTSGQRNESNAGKLRVVVLSGERALVTNLRQYCSECIVVASAYEAAAEILSAPTGAMVLDLRLLPVRHLRLLETARQMGVEILAVGSVPVGLTSEDLSGVRLTARADLPNAITRLSGTPEPFESTRTSPAETDRPPEPLGTESIDDFLMDPILEPLDESADGHYVPESPGESGNQNPHEDTSTQHPQLPGSPSGLLTHEEISALLENEQ